MDLERKIAVVTGAASGIGLALATRFAEAGMKVVLADVEAPALDASVVRLRDHGHDVLGVVTDVSATADLEALRDATLAAYGKVHVLCNNAGVVPTNSDPGVWGGTDKDWEWGLGVNLLSVVRGVRTFLPVMEAQGEEAHVVNTASTAGLIPAGDIYAVTKHAVVALTHGLYNHLAQTGSQVRCSVLCPGVVRTNILRSDRNRPAALSDGTGRGPSSTPGSLADLFARGMAPEDVADHTIEAIRAERFWIITADDTDALIRDRMESILDRSDPVALPAFG